MADSIMDEVVELGGKEPKKYKKVGFWKGGDGGLLIVTPVEECHPNRISSAILLALVVALVIVVVCCVYSGAGVRERLEDKRWALYTKEGCPACEQQLEILGGDYDLLVVCDSANNQVSAYTDNLPFECKDVEAFPLWFNEETGEKKLGLQTKRELRGMVDCQ
jgi:hypothetical protein